MAYLAHKDLDRSKTPRVHGNGFLQLDIGEGQRLHIWGHRDLPRQVVDTGIHNHRFDFLSEVLVGRVVNATYDTMSFDEHMRDWATHKVYAPHVREGEDTVLLPAQHLRTPYVKVMAPNMQLVAAGSSYAAHGPSYHETFTDRPSATLMVKTSQYGGFTPTVLVPMDKEPDNAFNRNSALEHGHLWQIIDEVLGV